MNRLGRIFLVGLFLLSIWLPVAGKTAASGMLSTGVAARQSTESEAEQLLQAMTTEERIGQLFMVTFEGDSASADSDIADLIRDYHVGGVVLLPQNDNFSGYGDTPQTPEQLRTLNNNLQSLALTGQISKTLELPLDSELFSQPPAPPASGIHLPLFIAMNHEGSPYDPNRNLGGFTAVPTNMAMGATWQPEYAQTIGTMVGHELSAVGINMLFGPALDVLKQPSPGNPADLGTMTFGGDPYWVGKLGQAYISGLHEGSAQRIAVIAKHFPGNGSSDRSLNDEVPTVRKSLEELTKVELAPFTAVTGKSEEETAVVDGLLTTHIRYQGFQGNISDTTAPVSFDPQALNTLMQLPAFSDWRSNGGLIVSDALGVRGVERFFDATDQEFPHRRVARDAFLAGNDLLYLGEFALGTAAYPEQLANMKDTMDWFAEKYDTDQTFQQRVDEAVLRILQLKLDLYANDFSTDNVFIKSTDDNVQTETGSTGLFELAQSGTTLISPSQSELAERLATLPGLNDKIIIFTDVREVQQCSECSPAPIISQTALEERMLALYGPDASGQLQPGQISSFSFTDLQDFLAAGGEPIFLPTPAPTATSNPELEIEDFSTPLPTVTPPPGFFVQEALDDVTWILFGMLDVNEDTKALNQFLAQRPDIARDTRIIAFAFDAPYYLDSTEISKLTAYFGLYSHSNPFIDAAVRALFQESPLTGSSPVSIDGVGYNLALQTQPDPAQIIEIFIVQNDTTQSPPSEAPLDAAIGDTLLLQTGVLRDRNGNQVPDGTIVQFILQDRIQGAVSIIGAEPTTDGMARIGYVLEASTGPGQFRITAVSGDAAISQAVDISIEDEAQVAIIVPTPTATITVTPSPIPTNTPIPSATPTAMPTATPVTIESPLEPGIRIGLSEFQLLMSMFFGLAITGGIGVLLSQRNDNTTAEMVSWLLWGVIGALILYLYYMLGLPGTAVLQNIGSWAGLLTTIVGGLLGLLLFQLWNQRASV
ncbi:MAG: hypothetical protein KDE48_07665 [Anaerolineales bacterium]|nr:hypothetical protein [Anaerolineales bacterium]